MLAPAVNAIPPPGPCTSGAGAVAQPPCSPAAYQQGTRSLWPSGQCLPAGVLEEQLEAAELAGHLRLGELGPRTAFLRAGTGPRTPWRRPPGNRRGRRPGTKSVLFRREAAYLGTGVECCANREENA